MAGRTAPAGGSVEPAEGDALRPDAEGRRAGAFAKSRRLKEADRDEKRNAEKKAAVSLPKLKFMEWEG